MSVTVLYLPNKYDQGKKHEKYKLYLDIKK